MNRTGTPGSELQREVILSSAQSGLLETSGWQLDNPEQAEQIARYVARDREFAERLARGVEPGPFVLVEHTLCVATQSTSGTSGKADLTAEFDALSLVPEIGPWLTKALGSAPELDGDIPHARVIEHDDSRTVLEATCEGRRRWPACLGGPAGSHEIERSFTIVIRRAPWRDRAVRRLQVVESKSLEVHLDPATVEA